MIASHRPLLIVLGLWAGAVALTGTCGPAFGQSLETIPAGAPTLSARPDEPTDTRVTSRPLTESSAEIRGRLSRADAAVRDGRHGDAAALYRSILVDLDPQCDRAWRSLVDLSRESPLPTEPGADEKLARDRLNRSVDRHLTTHWVILSDADSNWVTLQATRLERTFDQFHRFAERLGLRPLPLSERLVCILLKDYSDFARFARTHDSIRETWIAGYYASGPNYIVFYDSLTGPAFVDAEKQLDDVANEIRETKKRAVDARRNRNTALATNLDGHVRSLESFVSTERTRLRGLADSVVTVKTLHEATHQLAFNTRVQVRSRPNPFWLTEGLATNFESDEPRAAFGPQREQTERRDRFRALLNEDRLIPLAQLVGMLEVPGGDETTADVMYHQSYAFFKWVACERPEGLAGLFHQLARPGDDMFDGDGPDLGTSEGESAVFRSAFGDLNDLEEQWLQWERASTAAAERAVGSP